MTAAEIVVRATVAADRAPWLDMWAQYCAFYHADVPPEVTRTTFGRIIAPDGAVRGLVAEHPATGAIVGFANYVVHPFTWSERPACYLEDLFARPEIRGRGVGHALIERLSALGRAHGWSRIYWLTQAGNAPARRLYDRFAATDDFVRYVVDLDAAPPT